MLRPNENDLGIGYPIKLIFSGSYKLLSFVSVSNPGDGLLGDLREGHPANRHGGLEDLLEVPGDGALALPAGRPSISRRPTRAGLPDDAVDLLLGGGADPVHHRVAGIARAGDVADVAVGGDDVQVDGPAPVI